MLDAGGHKTAISEIKGAMMDPLAFKANLEQQAAQEVVNLIEREQLLHRPLRTLGNLLRFLWRSSIYSVRVTIRVSARSLRQIEALARSIRLGKQAS